MKRQNVNNNIAIKKPSLDALLDQDLHDLINATAYNFYTVYGKNNSCSVMISQEDLALEGYVGITIAYTSFDPNFGYTNNSAKVSFRTYAYPYMKNAMLTYCRKFGHQLSISEKSARDDLDVLRAINILHIDNDEDGRLHSNDYTTFDIPIGSGVDILEQDVDDYFLAGFTEFERNLVKDHLINGYSLAEVSGRHQISKSRASEIIRGLKERMIERAKRYVEDN